ncbi:LysR family transcriptional regulator [Vibrio sp. Isolate25]|uniref:LysR family transcriptional regulator n=1 Tax=Vibrio sp. Isolate25 TaxID=2908535 RepID=UPI001EFDDEC6|nr:LysR family transcriptional regulator [Vibrio sp. Isolate25]MCG9596909.1 LysR family transcriptional regulator [Vibrio sp. Isolate25]
MDKFTSMRVFAYVVEHGSFRRAAHHFGLSPTMISKHISHLERNLATQLIHRTTRKQTLTESGQLYYKECLRILEDIANAENLIQTLENRPKGTVKINCPITYGNKVIAPLIADFLSLNPNINVEMELSNELVDPHLTDADMMVRIGNLESSTLVARYLGDYQLIFCAAPSYLSAHDPIHSISQLNQHQCLGFSYSEGSANLTTQLARSAFLRGQTRLASNNGEVLRSAALSGVGVMLQPAILVADDLASGRLVEILKQDAPEPKPIHLLYKNKHLSLKNRTFADFILKNCQHSQLR